jgi:hypothetical protein
MRAEGIASLKLNLIPEQQLLLGENEIKLQLENLTNLECQSLVASFRLPPALILLSESRFRIPRLGPGTTNVQKMRLHAHDTGAFEMFASINFRIGGSVHEIQQTLHLVVRPPPGPHAFMGQESVVVSVSPTQPCHLDHITNVELRRLLNERLDLSEVKTACHDLEVDHENLDGNTKNEKIIELLGYLIRHDRLGELLTWLKDERPDLC